MMTNIIIIDGERVEDFLVTYLTFKSINMDTRKDY